MSKQNIIIYGLKSALILGVSCFIFGFAGPIIFTPEANQGPLLGIFLTGPAGFLVGGIVGFVIGPMRQNQGARESGSILRLVPKIWNWVLGVSAGLAAALIIFGMVYVPWYHNKYSHLVDNGSDLKNRDTSITQLSVRSLSDDELRSLSPFHQLHFLDFHSGWAVKDAEISDAGLRIISDLNLPKLEELMLGFCNKITDAGMPHITKIKTLKHLSLAGCEQITDAGLSNLIPSASIETLDLRGCIKITDLGLGYLGKMSTLKEVWLGGCVNVTHIGMDELRDALPNCKVWKDDQEWAYHTKN